MRRDELIGRTIAKRFRVKRVLGEGGMATVFVAEQDVEPREIALKVLRAELFSDKTFAKRFEREAKAAARVQHPNSVTIFDAGVEGDVSYIAMELLRGDDLYALLERHGVLSPRAAVTIVAEVCDALTVAHGLGIVHRDLKPENIMIVRDPSASEADGPSSVPLPASARVKVLDFGIAKLLDKQGDATGSPANRLESPTNYTAVTRVGTLIGTPAYMSPEQCALQSVDTRSDIYTCGLLLFQMVSGRLPFDGPTPLHIATKHLHEEAPALRSFVPDAHPTLEAIIRKTLAKRPADRHATAKALATALRRLLPFLPDQPYAGIIDDADSASTPIASEDSITSIHGEVLPVLAAAPGEGMIASAKTMVADGLAAPPPSVVVRDGDLPPRPAGSPPRPAAGAAAPVAMVPPPPPPDEATAPFDAPDSTDVASAPTALNISAAALSPTSRDQATAAAPRPIAVLARHAPRAPGPEPKASGPTPSAAPKPPSRSDTDAPATPTTQFVPGVESEPEDLAATLVRPQPSDLAADGRDSFASLPAPQRQPTLQSPASLPAPDRSSRPPVVEISTTRVQGPREPGGVQTLVSGQAAAAAAPTRAPLPSMPVASVILSPGVASSGAAPSAPIPEPRPSAQGPTFGLPAPPPAPLAVIPPSPPAPPPQLQGPTVSRALLLGVLIGVVGSALLFALAYVVLLAK